MNVPRFLALGTLAALTALTMTVQASQDVPRGDAAVIRAITGVPSSARHCVGGTTANVHSLGWIAAGNGYTVRFDSDIELSTTIVRINLQDETSTSVAGSPDFNFNASTPGTMALFVSGNGRSGCYRYQAQVDRSSAGFSTPMARVRTVAKPAKNPIRTMAISGLASSGQHCVGANSVSKVHPIGWIGEGASVVITFDSDFDPVAGVTITDPSAQRSRWLSDDDSGGDLDPRLAFTSPIAGTLALYVASGNERPGCYHYRVEIDGGAAQPTIDVCDPGVYCRGEFPGALQLAGLDAGM